MSSITARRRNRKRVDEDGDPEFQVAPMVDVLLVLMLFFMAITSTEVLKKQKDLRLAEANHGRKDPTQANQLVVNVAWNNDSAVFSMDEIRYATADAMQGVLAARIQQNPKAYVLIRADRDVEYSNISDLMTTCAAAGIATVSFAVISDPGHATDGTASN